jgi:hypothetical protein
MVQLIPTKEQKSHGLRQILVPCFLERVIDLCIPMLFWIALLYILIGNGCCTCFAGKRAGKCLTGNGYGKCFSAKKGYDICFDVNGYCSFIF